VQSTLDEEGEQLEAPVAPKKKKAKKVGEKKKNGDPFPKRHP
jgi:hypothetical protein